jgi:hypothetical protein
MVLSSLEWGTTKISFHSSRNTPPLIGFDRELLAAYLTVRHFHFLLEVRVFHILTDHKPLTYALHWVSEPWSASQSTASSVLPGRVHSENLPWGQEGQCGGGRTVQARWGGGLTAKWCIFKWWQAFHRWKCATVNPASSDQDLYTFIFPGLTWGQLGP